MILDVRELGHISGLVESAEGWMARVRAALLRDQQLANGTDLGDGGGGDGGGDGGGGGGVMDAEHTAELAELLREAEGIPVEMEEQQVTSVLSITAM